MNDVFIFVNIIFKIRYNNNYIFLNFTKKLKIYLQFYYNYFILRINFKLFN